MDTTMKHFSVSERKLQEVQEIAEREGRQDYDIMREALAEYLRTKDTDIKVHPSVPDDGVVRPNDRAISLNFDEMWIEGDGDTVDDPTSGDTVRAIEESGSYFTYYKFVFREGEFVCQTVAPITYELLEEFNERTEKYRV